MAHFDKIGGYPDELKARFNSFVVTQFDDSLSVEMQLRSFIKWISETIDLVNDMVDYLNMFIEMFDKRLQQEIVQRLNIWLEDGTLAHIINKEVFDMKVDREEFEAYQETVNDLLNTLENWVTNQLNEQNEKITKQLKEQNDFVEQQMESFDDRITQIVSINAYDVDPTGKKDSLKGFQDALLDLGDNGLLVLGQNAEYLLSEKLEVITDQTINIQGNGSTIRTDVDNPTDHTISRGLSFKGRLKGNTRLNGGLKMGEMLINVANTADMETGDLLFIKSQDNFATSRSYYKKGGTFTVGKVVNATQVIIDGSFPYDISDNAEIEIYAPVTVRIENLTVIGNKTLPAGYFGLALEFSSNSKLSNVVVDNFNHCIHLRNHVNTIVEQVKTLRSMFSGSVESYGLSSYMGTNLAIRNSTFASGRHALEISGFENSFKTTIENVTAKSESGGISFNMHQASYDTVIRNSIFDSVGLTNHVSMENCLIGGASESNLKTASAYTNSKIVFKDCEFAGTHVIKLTDDAQVQPNSTHYIGLLKFEGCTIQERLQLNMSTSYAHMTTDRLVIRDSNNIGVNISNPSTINKVVYDNAVYNVDANMIVGGEGRIGELHLINTVLRRRYNLVILNNFDRITIDNCKVLTNDSQGRLSLESKSESGTPHGKVTVINTDLRDLGFNTGGFDTLNIINSQVEFLYGRSNITHILQSTMENIK